MLVDPRWILGPPAVAAGLIYLIGARHFAERLADMTGSHHMGEAYYFWMLRTVGLLVSLTGIAVTARGLPLF